MFNWISSVFQQQPALAITFAMSVLSLIISASMLGWRIVDDRYRRYTLEDKELIEQLKMSLEHAYDSLVVRDNEHDTPDNDRLNWISAALHIETFRQLKLSLKTELYKNICNENEEYYRHKMHILLKQIPDGSWFERSNVHKRQDRNVDLKSFYIVYDFSQWREGRNDPLDNYSIEDIAASYDLGSPQHLILRDVIEKIRPNWAKDNLEFNKNS